MNKNKKFNIIKGHTLEEYRKKYYKLYKKGILISFDKNEINLMKNKTYWEIDNKYYEAPKCKFFYILFGNKKRGFATISVSLIALVSVITSLVLFLPKNYDYLTFIGLEDNTYFYLLSSGGFSKDELPNVSYSYNKKDWYTVGIDDETDTNPISFAHLDKDEKVYLKGNNKKGFSISESKFLHFAATNSKGENVRFSSEGNIMSLIDETCKETTIPNDYCFTRLFGATNYYSHCRIVKAPKLPAVNLTKQCYSYMFFDDHDLEEASELPSLEMKEKCYAYMFAQCISLKRGPALRSRITAPYCYDHMFYGNASITYLEVNITSWDRDGNFPCCFWVSYDGTYGMSQSGTFRCPKELVPNIDDPNNFSETRIPYHWTIETF